MFFCEAGISSSLLDKAPTWNSSSVKYNVERDPLTVSPGDLYNESMNRKVEFT